MVIDYSSFYKKYCIVGDIILLNRKAFLIGSPQVPSSIKDNNGYLKGVTPDINNMRNHLLSNKGGAWYNSEIQTFSNPTREELLQSVSGEYDYVVLQYSGHGFEIRNDRVFLLLDYFNIGNSIALDELLNNFTAPRCFCFIDCCRGLVLPKEAMGLEKSYKLFSMRDSNNQCYREKFDKIVNSCEKGRTVIFSCASGESAGEDSKGNGGCFSLAYLTVAKNVEVNRDKYLSVKNVFDYAVPNMKQMFPLASQNPVLIPERRIRYFPFSI